MCAGTMKYIHVECLRQWLNSRRTSRVASHISTFCWKQIECELCKMRLPFIVKDKGKSIELLEFDKPKSHYYVLESVTAQNLKIIHVITKHLVSIGRGLENDIRITDISVSRDHSQLKWNKDGSIMILDLASKFGSAVQVQKPLLLHN